jgi:cell division protease FtsH
MEEVNLSIDRIVIGLEGKQVARVKARQLTAFHEMGHAFVGSLIDENNGIEKLTLVPRGKHTRDNMDNAIFKSIQFVVFLLTKF